MEVFTALSCAGVMWITHSGYVFPSVGLTVARSFGGYHTKGMGCFLGSFGFFFFVFVLFGIRSKSRAFQFEYWETSTGDPIQLETTSEQ